MAHKKTTILDALATELQNLDEVAVATRILSTPTEARKNAPYIGVIAGTEEVIVEDATDIRYELDVDLILLKHGRDIEEMLDAVKKLLYSTDLASNVGAFQVRVVGQQEVAIVAADGFSSTRIVMTITYVVSKGTF